MAFIKQEPVPKPRNRRRRWQIPPLPHAGSSGFPGLSILGEIQHPPLAILLWQRFSDVMEWLRTPDARKAEVFTADDEYDRLLRRVAETTAIRGELLALQGVLDVGGGRTGREVSGICEKVGDWASREGYVETSALYYLLAAHASPNDARLNFAAGRADRVCARYHRAEQWFQRSIGLSRRASDDETYASAYLGWGLLEEQRGDHAAAALRYTRALRAAQRGGLRSLAAAAHHNMIPLAAQAGDFDTGHGHIVAAYKLYGRDETIIRLAADAAAFWAWFGHFQLARSVYSAVVTRVGSLPDRVQVLANLARAAAAIADAAEYARIAAQINQLASAGRHLPARVWVDLAEGARALGQTRTALDYAGRALEEADMRGEKATLAEARSILGAVQSGSRADQNAAAPEPLQRFASRLIRRVEAFPPCSDW